MKKLIILSFFCLTFLVPLTLQAQSDEPGTSIQPGTSTTTPGTSTGTSSGTEPGYSENQPGTGTETTPVDFTENIDRYLCLTAVQGACVITLSENVAGKVSASVQIKEEGKPWTDYTFGDVIILNCEGDKVYFRGNYYGNEDYYLHFTIGGPVKASGNVTTLTYGYMGITDLTIRPYAYKELFKDCTDLLTAPALPSTAISESCYLSMFQGCMFLEAAPELPATALKENCYAFMFEGCTALTTSPLLPAPAMGQNSYDHMFTHCASLNTVKVKLTTWYDKGNMSWLVGTSPTGTVYGPKELEQTLYMSYIPSGWTFSGIDIIKGDANYDGSVTISDALAVVYHVLNKNLVDFDKTNADIDASGSITITDALSIVKQVLQ